MFSRAAQDGYGVRQVHGLPGTKPFLYPNQICDQTSSIRTNIILDKVNTTFDDVYTGPDTVNSIRLLTLSLRNPMAFQTGILSRHVSCGVLLYGPPGMGKTMLARALAKEAGVKMMVITFADIQSELVIVAEKKVKALFQYARHHHPCIIFLDEADSCFRSRSGQDVRPWHISFVN